MARLFMEDDGGVKKTQLVGHQTHPKKNIPLCVGPAINQKRQDEWTRALKGGGGQNDKKLNVVRERSTGMGGKKINVQRGGGE